MGTVKYQCSKCPLLPHLPAIGLGGDGELAGDPGHLPAGLLVAPGAPHHAPPPPSLVLADVDVEVD